MWLSFPSLFLSYLCDICWTCRVFTGVTTGVFTPPPQATLPPLSCAPCAPVQWIHLHPDYRTNCHAGRKANQILRQQLGEEIAFSSQSQRSKFGIAVPRVVMERRKQRVKSGRLLGCSSWTVALLLVKLNPFPPPILTISRSPLAHPDTADQSPGDTRDYIPACSSLVEAEQ